MKRPPLKGTLTIRLTSPLRRRLAQEADERGVTPSELARLALENALGDGAGSLPTLGERTAGIVGCIRSRRIPAGAEARKALATWSPDRRG